MVTIHNKYLGEENVTCVFIKSERMKQTKKNLHDFLLAESVMARSRGLGQTLATAKRISKSLSHNLLATRLSRKSQPRG